jgi:hypothetical protein
MITICEKVWQRHVYFEVFHNPNGVDELKETSLFCFWILKLHPFYWEKEKDMMNYRLNSIIAFLVFSNGLNLYAKEKGWKVNNDSEIYNDIVYSFMYKDLSKEAIMDMARCLIIREEKDSGGIT